ncbi:tetrahydromethanopterin:alpha-L-glutamate ligase [Methanothrix sp.]|uniref:tetrahydromethanopterin:alpha-L-glutamate ligase n=1 Tax=Methanothrix sp. TaxID=90426 RepID=UPI002579B5CA|nr:tetrahydromethanopterin:alpha-L-glutamate ligase [Methanothrix sp.]NPU87058.1 RimK family alpha-L-glutamate ligase [Methanothrix sp.]
MKSLGIVVSNPDDWTARAISRGLTELGASAVMMDISELAVEIGVDLSFRKGGVDLLDLDTLIIRDMGRGAPQDVAFRFEALRSLADLGVTVINPPDAIVRAANKFATSMALRRAGVPTPRTVVTSSYDVALKTVERMGRAVCKPLFGYKGRDIALLRQGDADLIKDLLIRRGALYLQEFVETPEKRDIRAFVVGEEVAGAIYRVAPPGEWISNLARGGRAERCEISDEIERIAVDANRAVGTVYSGVDMLESDDGMMVIEVNGTPSGKGIFSALGVNVGRMIAGLALGVPMR